MIDLAELTALCGFAELGDFQRAHREWIEQELGNGIASRDDRWSEAIAVGSLAFVEKVKGELGIKALHRDLEQLVCCPVSSLTQFRRHSSRAGQVHVRAGIQKIQRKNLDSRLRGNDEKKDRLCQ